MKQNCLCPLGKSASASFRRDSASGLERAVVVIYSWVKHCSLNTLVIDICYYGNRHELTRLNFVMAGMHIMVSWNVRRESNYLKKSILVLVETPLFS